MYLFYTNVHLLTYGLNCGPYINVQHVNVPKNVPECTTLSVKQSKNIAPYSEIWLNSINVHAGQERIVN